MIKMENYGYSMGSPFHQELMNGNQTGNNGLNGNNVMGGHEQGLSPPYSNQSPPHSVQSNMALSPHAYLGKYHELYLKTFDHNFNVFGFYYF